MVKKEKKKKSYWDKFTGLFDNPVGKTVLGLATVAGGLYLKERVRAQVEKRDREHNNSFVSRDMYSKAQSDHAKELATLEEKTQAVREKAQAAESRHREQKSAANAQKLDMMAKLAAETEKRRAASAKQHAELRAAKAATVRAADAAKRRADADKVAMATTLAAQKATSAEALFKARRDRAQSHDKAANILAGTITKHAADMAAERKKTEAERKKTKAVEEKRAELVRQNKERLRLERLKHQEDQITANMAMDEVRNRTMDEVRRGANVISGMPADDATVVVVRPPESVPDAPQEVPEAPQEVPEAPREVPALPPQAIEAKVPDSQMEDAPRAKHRRPQADRDRETFAQEKNRQRDERKRKAQKKKEREKRERKQREKLQKEKNEKKKKEKEDRRRRRKNTVSSKKKKRRFHPYKRPEPDLEPFDDLIERRRREGATE